MRVLAYIASPLHVLSALAAIRTLHDESSVSVTLIVNHPTADAALLQELYPVITAMTERIAFIGKCVAVSNESLKPFVGRSDVEATAGEFREHLGLGDFSEIYYFHDVMGVLFAMLAQSYPYARRICFGDTLGVVFERKSHLSRYGIDTPPSIGTVDPARDNSSPWRRLLSALNRSKASTERKRYTELLTAPFGTPGIRPHAAALILPVDESGDFLTDIPWQVVPKELVLGLLSELASRCSAFLEYEDRLLAGRETATKFLLLTECNAEAQFLTFEHDIDMYCEIIERHCSQGSTIFLKPHPAEWLRRYDAISTRLGDRYELIEFDRRFKRYPIEFAVRLARECTPISMSYPSVSLRYLHGVDIVQPMSRAFIEKWYAPKYWDILRRSRAMMDEPRERLTSWDGRSLLWSGRPAPSQ